MQNHHTNNNPQIFLHQDQYDSDGVLIEKELTAKEKQEQAAKEKDKVRKKAEKEAMKELAKGKKKIKCPKCGKKNKFGTGALRCVDWFD